ncbi:MAG TPA: HAMP domain-containing protein [Candidatus Binatia bacterium]|nr:HAMP domain-containing protein [Candidatus Binatia bacterium]
MTRSITELVGMAKALSEGEVEQRFQQHFQGELGQLASYLEAVRQTLQSLSSTAEGSKDLLPQASYGFVEINKEAETGFDSVWETVEKMQSDHAAARRLLGSRSESSNGPDITELHAILDKNHENLLALMSFLSFQDVLRQRLEKVRRIIGEIEEKTLELSVKFKMKANEKCIKLGNRAELDRRVELDQNLVDQLMASLR